MRGRPALYTSYRADEAALNTTAKRAWLLAFMVFLIWLPFQLDAELKGLVTATFGFGVGAIGLNLITGLAGQVSLAHAFFLGIGFFTGAVLAGETDDDLLGLGINDMAIWLPAAGLVAALVGAVVAPVATRLRGLYLAIVTLGLVFVGEFVFRELRDVTGGFGGGRSAPDLILFGIDLTDDVTIAGVELEPQDSLYFVSLIVLVGLAVLAKNLTRSAIGRAFMAVRDRDVAAALMGVNLTKYKLIAFVVSSFYAGVAGALLGMETEYVVPESYNLFLSITFLAIVFIGGAGTLAGVLMGAAFVTLLPRLTQEAPALLPFVSDSPNEGWLSPAQLESVIYGLLIVAFVVLEPRGLYGIWLRARSYLRTWPFSSQ